MAGAEKLAHIGGESRYGVGTIKKLTPFVKHISRFVPGLLQLVLAISELSDTLRRVGHLHVRRLDDMPDSAQPPLHVLKLLLNGLQTLTLLPRLSIHFLIKYADKAVYVALGENILAKVEDDRLLNRLGIDARRLA